MTTGLAQRGPGVMHCSELMLLVTVWCVHTYHASMPCMPVASVCPQLPTTSDARVRVQALAEREAKIREEVTEMKKTFFCEVSDSV